MNKDIEWLNKAVNITFDQANKGESGKEYMNIGNPPKIKKIGENIIANLDKDKALKQADYLENIVFAGSQNVPNMIYNIDGDLYKYKFTMLGGSKLMPMGKQHGGETNKDRFGFGTEDPNQLKDMFKKHSSAWLRLTEFPSALDPKRRDWKGNTDRYMQDPLYQQFINAQSYDDKLAIISERLHPVFKDSDPKEIMNEMRNYI